MSVITSAARSSRLRPWLLASAGTVSLILGGAAHAEAPTGTILEAQGTTSIVTTNTAGTAPTGTILEPQIVVTPPNTPTLARDSGVNGVGQMIVDQKNGFIGLCTGTLINPRTVIFASHCVNESPTGTAMNPWGYGTGTNQLPIGFGFSASNNTAGNSAFGHWLNGVSGGAKYQTNVADYMYNVNQVLYNPQSLGLGLSNNFLQADVALASLDTPAANVPTWAILLSALPVPGSLSDTSGTGYHVTVEGYGNNGVGPTGGVGGIDYRRRVAENYVGLLGSLDDIDVFLFGSASGLPQNLYQVDFDSPGHTNQFDFNVFKDNALPYVSGVSPGEGVTASGDSGGPLIVDRAFAKQVIIGVLSGGSRYYNAQASGAYGTSSFYQPLYLFWDYIAANNPYRYVGSKVGDGAWTDPTHWVTNLDPAYNVLVNGQLVNGVPTALGDGINGTAGKFGAICNEGPGYSDCYNVATGVETYNGTNYYYTPTGGTAGTTPLPTATLANGLPGATNFVPNNINPNAATQTNARYFDVTLAATGTTTLSSTVTVDRFTMTTAGAKLNVASGASLTSLININQLDGLITNNGTISSVGDYFLLSGGITGAGRFNAPFLTSAMGMFAPGTTGTTGTITVGGNLVMASGTRYFVDLGANGVSDRLAVVSTTFAADGTTATNGFANVGGQVGFAAATGATIQAGNVYTIVSSQGGVSGRFATPSALSAIITPTLTYTPNAVQVTLAAGLYANVVANTPVQRAYAQLLDQNRGNQAALSALFTPLDLQNAATIQGTLESLAPRAETLNRSIGTVAVDNMSRFYRDRLTSLEPGHLGGTLALVGQPMQLAALNLNGLPGQQEVRTDAGDTILQQGKLPDTVSGFLAGGYLDGKSRPMSTAIPLGGRDTFDGYYLAGGIETELGAKSIAGFSLSYTDVGGNTTTGETASGKLYEGTIYGKANLGHVVLDGVFSAGAFNTRTKRGATIVGTSYTLRANGTALALSGEIGAGVHADMGAIKIGPRVALRASRILSDTVAESGGGPALVYKRGNFDSLQGRAGLTIGGGDRIRPYLSAYYVHDFADQPAAFGANFVGGVGPAAIFALAGQDKDWGEVGGGITFGGKTIDLSLGADTTLYRKDVSNQSYRGSITFHF